MTSNKRRQIALKALKETGDYSLIKEHREKSKENTKARVKALPAHKPPDRSKRAYDNAERQALSEYMASKDFQTPMSTLTIVFGIRYDIAKTMLLKAFREGFKRRK